MLDHKEVAALPTVEDLLKREGLGLELLEGDPGATFGAVRNAGSPRDRPWLAVGDLRLGEGPWPAARTGPDLLFAESPAAIVFALTPRRGRIPEGLREKARSTGTTLLQAPPTVSLDRIEEAALELTLPESLPAMEAGAGLYRHLLAALTMPKPERDVLERVARLTRSTLVLLAPWGEVLARAGRAGWSGPRGAVAELSPGRYRIEGRNALVVRIERSGRMLGLLVCLEAEPRLLPVLEVCASLLRVVLLERSADARQDQADRARLLSSWLAGEELELLAPRLGRAGFDLKGSLLALVAEPGRPAPSERAVRPRRALVEEIRQAGEEYLLALGVGVLSDRMDESCLWVAALGSIQPAPLLRALEAAAGVPVRLGVSRAHPVGDGPSTAYFQAALALQSVPGGGGSAAFSELDPIYWVLQQQTPSHLRALRDGLVGAIKEADDGKLWTTLVKYLAAPGNHAALAEELGIHVNTLRYRLRRIEELIGRPLSQPETLAQLYLADRIDRLLTKG